MPEITLRDIYAARQRIAPVVRRTPLIHSPALGERAGTSVHLKLECLQNSGSFKVRGAANKLAGLSADEKTRGVITFSTGNHGRAVAYVARQAGVRAVICLSNLVPANKVEGVRKLGAEVVAHGKSQDEAMDRAFAELADYEAEWPCTGFALYEQGADGVWRKLREFVFGGAVVPPQGGPVERGSIPAT